jgi:hypothetical protein
MPRTIEYAVFGIGALPEQDKEATQGCARFDSSVPSELASSFPERLPIHFKAEKRSQTELKITNIFLI